MKTAHFALVAAYEFAWKCGVIVIAIALLAAMTPKDRDFASTDSPGSVPQQVVSAAEGRNVEVNMEMAEGSYFSNCSLVDERGRELLHATYNRSGGLLVQWGEAFPVRPGCTATRDGRFQLDVMNDTIRCGLNIRQDGVMNFKALGSSLDDSRAPIAVEDGKLVDELWFQASETTNPHPIENQFAPSRSGDATTP